MNKAVLIIGLPGSGKTYLAKERYVPVGYILIDDPKELPELKVKGDVVVTDPHLCKKSIRDNCIKFFENLGYSVECIYFENCETKCKKLIALRNDGRVIESFQSFCYTIPSWIIPVPIYEP